MNTENDQNEIDFVPTYAGDINGGYKNKSQDKNKRSEALLRLRTEQKKIRKNQKDFNKNCRRKLSRIRVRKSMLRSYWLYSDENSACLKKVVKCKRRYNTTCIPIYYFCCKCQQKTTNCVCSLCSTNEFKENIKDRYEVTISEINSEDPITVRSRI